MSRCTPTYSVITTLHPDFLVLFFQLARGPPTSTSGRQEGRGALRDEAPVPHRRRARRLRVLDGRVAVAPGRPAPAASGSSARAWAEGRSRPAPRVAGAGQPDHLASAVGAVCAARYRAPHDDVLAAALQPHRRRRQAHGSHQPARAEVGGLPPLQSWIPADAGGRAARRRRAAPVWHASVPRWRPRRQQLHAPAAPPTAPPGGDDDRHQQAVPEAALRPVGAAGAVGAQVSRADQPERPAAPDRLAAQDARLCALGEAVWRRGAACAEDAPPRVWLPLLGAPRARQVAAPGAHVRLAVLRRRPRGHRRR